MIKLSWDDAANEGIPQKSLMELNSDVPFPDDTNALLHSIGLLVFMILQRFFLLVAGLICEETAAE